MMVKVPSKSPLLLGKKLEWQKEKINKNRNITAKRIESEDKWPSPGSFFSINLKMLDHSPSLLTSSNSNLSETVKDILPNSLISPCEPVSNLTFTNKEKHLQSKDDLKETRKRLIYSPLKGTPPKRLRVENEAVDLESSFRFDNTMRNYLRPFDSSTPNQPKKKPSSPTSSTFDHHNNDTDIDFKRVANRNEVSTPKESARNNKSKLNSSKSLSNQEEVSTPKESAKNNKSKLNSNKSLSNQEEVLAPKESAKNNKSKLNSNKSLSNQEEVSTPKESAKNNKSKLNSNKSLSNQEVLAPKESAKNNKSKLNSDKSLSNQEEVLAPKESAKNNKSKLNSNKSLSNQEEVLAPKESAKNNKSKLNSNKSLSNQEEVLAPKESAKNNKSKLNSNKSLSNQEEVLAPKESANNNKSKLNSNKSLSNQEEVLAPKESAKNNKSKLNSKSDDTKRTSNSNQKEVSTHMEYAKNNKSIMNSILKANEKEVLTPKKSAKNNKSKLNSSISKSGDNKRTSKPYRRKRKLCMPNRRRSEKACQTSKLNKTKNTNELETNKNQTKTESDYALNNESEVVKNASKTKSKKIHILSERSNIQSENTKSNHLSGLELKNLTRTERDYAIDKQIIENMATDSDESENVNCASNCSSKLKKKKSKNILPKKSLPQNLFGPFIQNEDEQSSSKLPETVRVKMHGQNIMANLKLVLPVSEKWDKPSHNSTHVETIKHFSFLHFCYGQLKIKAFGEKGLQKSKCSAIMFFVLFGNLEVTIHETTFSVGPGVNFLVPQGNVYNIVNRSNMEARLIYMQVKDPKEIN
ncbi:centromere protein C isoform X8 [Hydra vulgaris]|uniref:Centromere protein C isoform X8 n=1 Tax=Hydra vulgaris TaxID=6087 RepID=A0ABM4C4P7_HYDVU